MKVSCRKMGSPELTKHILSLTPEKQGKVYYVNFKKQTYSLIKPRKTAPKKLKEAV